MDPLIFAEDDESEINLFLLNPDSGTVLFYVKRIHLIQWMSIRGGFKYLEDGRFVAKLCWVHSSQRQKTSLNARVFGLSQDPCLPSVPGSG